MSFSSQTASGGGASFVLELETGVPASTGEEKTQTQQRVGLQTLSYQPS